MNKQTIPAFSLARQIKTLRPQIAASLDTVLESQQFIGGQFIQAIEAQIAQYLNVKYVISCNSGTDALWMALQAITMSSAPADLLQQRSGLAGKIVLTTPFSFIASSSEIVALGGHPVFIDIEKDSFNMNPKLLASWLESNAIMNNGTAIHCATGFPIAGIIPVDLFGQCVDYVAIKKIATEWNLWIVEDCAQAIGAELNGRKAGTFGNIGTFSFYPTKNLGAFGDAGCCVTDDPVLAERLLQLRNHGRKANYEYEGLGINSRMDAFQAVILSVKLPLLDGVNERRRYIAARYQEAFASVPFLTLPQQKYGTHVFHQYSVLVEEGYRSVLEKHLSGLGVQTRLFYPQALPEIGFLRSHQALTTANPVATYAALNILSLPMWPELEDSEIDYVIECVKSMPYAQASAHASVTQEMSI